MYTTSERDPKLVCLLIESKLSYLRSAFMELQSVMGGNLGVWEPPDTYAVVNSLKKLIDYWEKELEIALERSQEPEKEVNLAVLWKLLKPHLDDKTRVDLDSAFQELYRYRQEKMREKLG